MGALSVIKEELPKWWQSDEAEALRGTVNTVLGLTPLGVLQAETPTDVALSLLNAPGKTLKKLGALSAVASYSPEAEAGLFTRLPSEIAKQLRILTKAARKASPDAAIEFGTTDTQPLMRGTLGRLTETPQPSATGYNLHSHGAKESFLPSSDDMTIWANLPKGVKHGVVKVGPKKTQAVVLDMKGKDFPTYPELVKARMKAERLKPGIEEALDVPDNVELNSAKMQWILDQARANNIDAYFSNVDIPKELTEGVHYLPGSHYRVETPGPGVVGRQMAPAELIDFIQQATPARTPENAEALGEMIKQFGKPHIRTNMLYGGENYTDPVSTFQLTRKHELDLPPNYLANLAALQTGRGAGTQALQEARRAGPYGLVATPESREFYEKMMQRLPGFEAHADPELRGVAYQHKKEGGLVEANDDFAYPGMF